VYLLIVILVSYAINIRKGSDNDRVSLNIRIDLFLNVDYLEDQKIIIVIIRLFSSNVS